MLKTQSLLNLDKGLSALTSMPDNISGISSFVEPLENTIVFIKSSKFLKKIKENTLSLIGIIDKNFYDDNKDNTEILELLDKRFDYLFTSDNISKSMCLLSKPFYDKKYENLNLYVDGRQMGTASIDPDAQIAQGVFIGDAAVIGKGVIIMPGAVIGPYCKIGDNTVIYPNVSIYAYCEIGSDCRIHANTTIGSDGFGYNFYDGIHNKIWHLYNVKIGNDVEIGSSSQIDCGCFNDTIIKNGTKIDNQVQVSHNSVIGNHVIMCGKSGVAGSCTVEDYAVFAAGSGCAPGVTVKKGATLAAAAVVSENAIIESGKVVAGHPAGPLKEWLRNQAKLRRMLKDN
ncbi:MAG: UDP-3-O-(3-hydroxymyristoyl)glucosamine N-acyltransferase [Bacteriovoracaceae bacterium]|jgi:UDP-3-O-[3-hydroxymyristoyl] glucosamine N-acyltransferase|nr:UDP-3-O-(3-hydroxymyristoyl)glucosamine N-acyltransferase [Bacteriovoracaceae bacterium]